MSYRGNIKYTETSWHKSIFNALPDNIINIVGSLPSNVLSDIEEIRIRKYRPLMISARGRDYFLCEDGSITSFPEKAYIITKKDTENTMQLISDYSIYAFNEEIKNGYITLIGGHRVGMTGKVVLDKGKIKTLKYINSFNFRISKEVIGVADKVMPYITRSESILHTLILSPPQMGKTTLLRDIARKLSNGFLGFKGVKIGVVDERSEIAGCFEGIPQRNVGIQTDVLDGCPKAEGIMMLIRSMSPKVIITDEIGRLEDAMSIEEALNAGIKVITSAHASDLSDALNRPVLSALLDKKVFERILVLGSSLGVGTLEKVYTGDIYAQIIKKPIR